MWNFTSSCLARDGGKSDKLAQDSLECSDDEISSDVLREEGLECPICYESFNIVENVPYVLWCGHTLCKNCILGLQWAVLNFPTLPFQLPLLISCPWCNLLSFRLVYKGNLKFPRKNYFLLWMVQSINGDRVKTHADCCEDHPPVWSQSGNLVPRNQVSWCNRREGQNIHHSTASGANNNQGHFLNYLSAEGIRSFVKNSLTFLFHMTAKFPFVILLLSIVVYAIPASAVILTMYILITILFALPSFLILYFAYPCLDWLIREMIT